MEETRASIATIEAQLERSDQGVISNLSNLIIIISQDPVLRGLCAHDEFNGENVLQAPPPPLSDTAPSQPGPYPRAWERADVSMVRSYIQRVWIKRAARDDTEEAMGAVAAMRRLHPPKQWLSSLRWDGRPRLDAWMIHGLGAEDTAYHRAVARSFLIAAVRRIRQPGCKFDHMPVLEGPQDAGKSTAIRRLFSDTWFTDALPDALHSRDAALALHGIWCVELAELEQLLRNEAETIKAFLSRSTDRYRPPYGQAFVWRPRQCVLIGTTNSYDYLRDSTGNRRFWPVRCGIINIEWFDLCREQVWAEAAARETLGEAHWIKDTAIIDTARTTQAARLQDDVWEERVLRYVSDLSQVTTSQVLSHCIEVAMERQGRREQMRVAYILKVAGWEQVVAKSDGKSVRVWKALARYQK